MTEQKKESASFIAEMVERLGLSTVLLLAAAYFGYQSVILPIANSYKQMVEGVAETNKLLQEELEENDKADGERVQLIIAQMSKLEAKIDKLLEASK